MKAQVDRYRPQDYKAVSVALTATLRTAHVPGHAGSQLPRSGALLTSLGSVFHRQRRTPPQQRAWPEQLPFNVLHLKQPGCQRRMSSLQLDTWWRRLPGLLRGPPRRLACFSRHKPRLLMAAHLRSRSSSCQWALKVQDLERHAACRPER